VLSIASQEEEIRPLIGPYAKGYGIGCQIYAYHLSWTQISNDVVGAAALAGADVKDFLSDYFG